MTSDFAASFWLHNPAFEKWCHFNCISQEFLHQWFDFLYTQYTSDDQYHWSGCSIFCKNLFSLDILLLFFLHCLYNLVLWLRCWGQRGSEISQSLSKVSLCWAKHWTIQPGWPSITRHVLWSLSPAWRTPSSPKIVRGKLPHLPKSVENNHKANKLNVYFHIAQVFVVDA